MFIFGQVSFWTGLIFGRLILGPDPFWKRPFLEFLSDLFIRETTKGAGNYLARNLGRDRDEDN